MTVYQSTTIQKLEEFKVALREVCVKHGMGIVPDINGDDPAPLPDDACLAIVPYESNRELVNDFIDLAAVEFELMQKAGF